jgi:hypothetical protein
MQYVDFHAPKSAKPPTDKKKEYNASRELKPFKAKGKGAQKASLTAAAHDDHQPGAW